jgi:hypothetical protein
VIFISKLRMIVKNKVAPPSAPPSSTYSMARAFPARERFSISARSTACSKRRERGTPSTAIGSGRARTARDFLKENPTIAREIESRIRAKAGVASPAPVPAESNPDGKVARLPARRKG